MTTTRTVGVMMSKMMLMKTETFRSMINNTVNITTTGIMVMIVTILIGTMMRRRMRVMMTRMKSHTVVCTKRKLESSLHSAAAL